MDASVPESGTQHPERISGSGAPPSPDSLRAAWNEHRRWVAAILMAHKPKWADLEDLLQDVAVSLLRHGHELRDPAAAKPWLRSVALNAARLAARKGKLREHDHLPDEDPGDTRRERPAPPEAAAAQAQEADRVLALAAKLPDSFREPLLLKAVQGLSYRQIGQILGLPETTIETRIARGRRMLRELASEPASTDAT
jgi:RNA polymerase sigma factor (sigma-70 family)